MLDLIFKEVKDNKNDLKKIKKLYKEAFPIKERVPFKLLKFLAKEERAKFYAMYFEETFIGFVYNIYYEDIVYINYFAIKKI